MTPVDQQMFYQDSPRVYGDCTRASLASLLDLSLNEVPHFLQMAKGQAYEYYDLIEDFLLTKGLIVLWHRSLAYHWRPGDPDCYHLISGRSPRHAGIGHMVAGLNGQIVHDPHPSRAGLLGDASEWKNSFILKGVP